MTLLDSKPEGGRADGVRDLVRKGNRYWIVGSLVAGLGILGPVGAAMLVHAYQLLRRAQRQGATIRPWALSILGAMWLVDVAENVGWALDFFAHDTGLAKTFFSNWGQLFDAGYYKDYNSLSAGGPAAHGEKAFEVMMVCFLLPMRLAAGIAFLQMKRWGQHFMAVTAWMYFMFWIGYTVNMSMDFMDRFGMSLFGVTGWWLYDIGFVAVPFIVIPYLYTMDRTQMRAETS